MGSRGLTLVCPVRPGETNEPLRYMLRSVDTYLPGARVILAGHRPSWVRGVEHIPVSQERADPGNVVGILRQVCADPVVPEEFVLVNDDFFAMVPGAPTPLLHRGPLVDLVGCWRGGWYTAALSTTVEVLAGRGVVGALAYDRLHQPMPIVRDVLGEVLTWVEEGRPVLHRSLYGNRVGGGVAGVDVKVRRVRDLLPAGPWVSTSPSAWAAGPGRVLRARFRQVCRYEG